MRFIGMIFCAFVATGANSQTIIDACERVAGYELGLAEVHSFDVQAFPELNPPRVRMRVKGEAPFTDLIADALRDGLTARAAAAVASIPNNLRDFGLIRCEFESNAPPFGLSLFECDKMPCSISDKRLEELQVLLRRAYPH
jgi:hypothetical protein